MFRNVYLKTMDGLPLIRGHQRGGDISEHAKLLNIDMLSYILI